MATAPAAPKVTAAPAVNPYAKGITIPGMGANGASGTYTPVWNPAKGMYTVDLGGGHIVPIGTAQQMQSQSGYTGFGAAPAIASKPLMSKPSAAASQYQKNAYAAQQRMLGQNAASKAAIASKGQTYINNPGGGGTQISYTLDPKTGMYIPSAVQGVGQDSWWQANLGKVLTGSAIAAIAAPLALGVGAAGAAGAGAGAAGAGTGTAAGAGGLGVGDLSIAAPSLTDVIASTPALTAPIEVAGGTTIGGLGATAAPAVTGGSFGGAGSFGASSFDPGYGSMISQAGTSGAASFDPGYASMIAQAGAAPAATAASTAGGLGSALRTIKNVGNAAQALGKLTSLGAGAAVLANPSGTTTGGSSTAPLPAASTAVDPNFKMPPAFSYNGFEQSAGTPAAPLTQQQASMYGINPTDVGAARAFNGAAHAQGGRIQRFADGGQPDISAFDPGYSAMIQAATPGVPTAPAADAPTPITQQDPLQGFAKALQAFDPNANQSPDELHKRQLNANQRNDIAARMAALTGSGRPLSPTILRKGMASGFAEGGSVLEKLKALFSAEKAAPVPIAPPMRSSNGFGSPGDPRYGNSGAVSDDTPNPGYIPAQPQVNAINGAKRAAQIDDAVNQMSGGGYAGGGVAEAPRLWGAAAGFKQPDPVSQRITNAEMLAYFKYMQEQAAQEPQNVPPPQDQAPSGSALINPFTRQGPPSYWGDAPGHAMGGAIGGLGATAPQPTQAYVSGGSGGQADTIPAKLSHGEYVMDADVVSALGDGNNEAGANKLDQMREAIRAHKRSAPPTSIPPKAHAPMAYLKGKK